MSNRQIRLSLPSKGRMAEDSLQFLSDCGLSVQKPNPRQYEARIPIIPDLTVLFQRPGDIVVSVRDGSVDFGITGIDVIEERRGEAEEILILHDFTGRWPLRADACRSGKLGKQSSTCSRWSITARNLGRRLRVATKYPNLTEKYLCSFDLDHDLISAEGIRRNRPSHRIRRFDF